MKKFKLSVIGLILALVLLGCNSEEESEQTVDENEPSNEEVNQEETEENNGEEDTSENTETDDSDKEVESPEDLEALKNEAFEKYPEALTIEESGERKINDGITNDHVKFTINSYQLVDELEGTKPSQDKFLVVDITLENLIDDYNYGLNFIKSVVYDDMSSTSRLLENAPAKELSQEENGISNGQLIYDVKDSPYYRLSFYDTEWLLFKDEQTDTTQ